MTYREQAVWLQCTFPGCGSGTTADARHLDNLTAAGGWECHLHDGDEVSC